MSLDFVLFNEQNIYVVLVERRVHKLLSIFRCSVCVDCKEWQNLGTSTLPIVGRRPIGGFGPDIGLFYIELSLEGPELLNVMVVRFIQPPELLLSQFDLLFLFFNHRFQLDDQIFYACRKLRIKIKLLDNVDVGQLVSNLHQPWLYEAMYSVVGVVCSARLMSRMILP